MSYDLIARSDGSHTGRVPRSDVDAALRAFPGIEENGPDGYVLERGEAIWMEIDVERAGSDERAREVNAIRFHVPTSFAGDRTPYLEVALGAADALGWELVDLRTDRTVTRVPRARKRGWRFW